MMAERSQSEMVKPAAPGSLSPWWKVIPAARRSVSGLQQRSLLQARATAPADVEQLLGGFSQSMEGVFLRTGERLMDMQLQTRAVARQTTEVAELLSGDDGSLVVLDGILQAAGAEANSGGITDTIAAVQENSRSIHHAIESFGRLVNTFDVLGVMTRIESARFRGAEETFQGLADTVAELSRQIREDIGETAESAEALLKTASDSVVEVRRVAQTRRENLGPLARQTSAGIQNLAGRRNQVSQANARLAADFEGVSGAIGDLVQALQSHDIVRQQIEHIQVALSQAGVSGSSATLRLQAAQLEHSRATFEGSLRQIADALARIDRNIEDVAGQSANLLQHHGLSEEPDISAVDSSLGSILTVLASNARANRRLTEAVVSVGERVSEISRTVRDIQSIGFEMQRIALNAAIQAVRLGPGGGALEIVANAIQGLAREADLVSGTVDARLQRIREAALALDQAAAICHEADQIPRLRQGADALKSSQEKARAGQVQTLLQIEVLKRQVGETISGFGSHGHIVEQLSNAVRLLEELSGGDGPDGKKDVEQIAAAYTMQSERAVHQALFQPDDVQPEPALRDAAPAEETGSDDNVEFF